MNANLLYITEEELRLEFQQRLCDFRKKKDSLFLIIKLKPSTPDLQPMINNLKEIRIQKAKNRINNWSKICFDLDTFPNLQFIENTSQLGQLNFDFSKIDKISIYSTVKIEKEIKPYLLKHFKPKNLQFIFFDNKKDL